MRTGTARDVTIERIVGNEDAQEQGFRVSIKDLTDLIAMPLERKNRELTEIIDDLLEVLCGILPLEFVYLRLKAPADGSLIEAIRVTQPRPSISQPSEIGRALECRSTGEILASPQVMPNPVGEGTVSVRLLNDLLDVSSIIAGNLRLDLGPVEIASVAEAGVKALRPAAESRGIQLQMVLDPQTGRVIGDQVRLQQVIYNLLSNAIKFTPQNGRIEVRLKRVNAQVEIIVSDTGAGIHHDFLPYVFDRYRRDDRLHFKKSEGLGLGLAIVLHLVTLHQGTVHADSDGEGKGATFTVKLPLCDP